MLKRLARRLWREFVARGVDLLIAIWLACSSKAAISKQSVVVMRIDGIGDAVLFSGCLRYIRSTYANRQITVLAQNYVSDYFKYCPWIDGVLSLNIARFRDNPLYRFWFLLVVSNLNPETLLCPILEPSDASKSLVKAFRCGTVVAFASHLPFVRGAQNIRSIITEGWSGREIDLYPLFIKTLIGGGSSPAYRSEIWSPDASLGIVAPIDGPYVVIVPSGSWSGKTWPSSNWVSLIRILASEYTSISLLLMGGAADQKLCSEIKEDANCAKVRDLSGLYSLVGLQEIIRKAVLYIGADTGALHLSVASDVPTVAIMGGGHPGRFFPYGDTNKNVAVTKEMPCFGCDWKCRYSEVRCITEVAVADVMAAIRKQLG